MGLIRNFFRRLYSAAMHFSSDDGPLVAAGTAYYVALSFFPLLLVLLAGIGAALEWTALGQDARSRLMDAIEKQASPELAAQVDSALKVVSNKAPTSGPIGFAVLVISAVAIFAQMDQGFDRIWDTPDKEGGGWRAWIFQKVWVRLKALLMLIGVGGFVLAVMIASMVVSGVQSALEPVVTMTPWMDWAASLAINLALNWLAFSLIYLVVPKVRIRLLNAVRGGLLAAILWEVGRQALALYLLRLNYPNAYGIIGSFLAIMLWAYYAMLVLFYGAEYVRVLGERTAAE